MKKLSDLLLEEREKKGLSLDEVEKATKIKKEFLEAIEEGDFHTLPSQSYALGFVKTYAKFLGLSEEKISAFFRREYKEEDYEIVPRFRKHQHVFNRQYLSPRNFLIFSAFLLIVGYILFQYSSFIFGPKLSLTSPKNGQVLSGNVVEIRGKADPYATVIVDNDEAYVSLDGTFKKSLYIFPGEKKITIVAKNRFGKETRETITIKVQ